MEQHLAESQWSPSEASQQLTTLHHTVVAKERDITRLEDQVDEQRKMRLNDAKQVEAKAAKIKEWVTNKLREVRTRLYRVSLASTGLGRILDGVVWPDAIGRAPCRRSWRWGVPLAPLNGPRLSPPAGQFHSGGRSIR